MTKKISFRSAVTQTNEVSNGFKQGKQAIKNNERAKIELKDNNKCGGSLFIDECLLKQGLYPNENRWDYAIDYDGEVYFVEVHSATSREVDTVIRKFRWLKNWLHDKAPLIGALKCTKRHPYVWIQSGSFDIPKHSAHYRRTIENDLKPIPKLRLG